MFKLHPQGGFLVVGVLVLPIGGLLAAYFFIEDRSGIENQQWRLVIFGTLLIVLLLVVAAFSRYRFSHLRNHRPGYERG
jgi:putative copper export protein